MTNAFSLEDLDREIERQYAPVKFTAGDEEFVLVSLLRTDKKVREAVMARLTEMEKKDDSDVEEFDEEQSISDMEFILSSVTKDRKGARLVKALGHDLLRLMTLLRKWQEATQPGEAQDSPS